MRKVYTCVFVMAIAGLFAMITGCEEQAAKEPSATPEKQAKASCEMTKQAPKPAAEKPKEAVKPSGKGPTMGPYDFVADWQDEPGFIGNWLIAGTFPNPGERPDNAGFNTDYLKADGGEASYVPTNGKEIKDPNGSMVKWQQYKSDEALVSFFNVPFLKLEQGQEDVLCYCACWLESDADKDVEIRIGSDDGYKLWLNGKEIGVLHEYRSASMDNETYKVKLNKGMNLIFIKVDQDYGEYEFMLRVVNAEGKAVTGIKIWN